MRLKKCVITTLHILRQQLFAYVHYGQTVIHILHYHISQEILIVQQFNLVIGWVRANKIQVSPKKMGKWGPFQQFGSHEDQVLNWGPLWKHCKLGQKIYWRNCCQISIQMSSPEELRPDGNSRQLQAKSLTELSSKSSSWGASALC